MSESQSKAQQELASIRDTAESIWVAIVLAFVLRAFVVEAFVIPTGSMAPRLLGEHLNLTCPACGYQYAFGWSPEQERQDVQASGGRSGQRTPGRARCPSCSFDAAEAPYVSGGDRVLVMKYLYRFRPAQPWDVVVFKNPQDNRQNYIKRLIGLPGETIEIVHGDVYVRPEGERDFTIRRKENPKVQDAMWQVVFYNDYRPDPGVLAQKNTQLASNNQSPIKPPFWELAGTAKDAWKPPTAEGRTFLFDGCPPSRQAELVFRGADDEFQPRYGYNAGMKVDTSRDIVSDLKVSATFYPKAADSAVAMELSCFEHLFRGLVGADGKVSLLYRRTDDGPAVLWTPLAADGRISPLSASRGHQVALTNVDLRVTLWVDGQPLLASQDRQDDTPRADRTRYPLDYRLVKQRLDQISDAKEPRPIPQPQVRVAVSGGACELRHLALQRDVYYTCPYLESGSRGMDAPCGDFARELGVCAGDPGWGVQGNAISLARNPKCPDLDQFFVMGDNSPQSLDGRLWTAAAATLRLHDPTQACGDPNLAVGDVRWPSFADKIARDGASAADTPGKRIWQAVSTDLQTPLKDFDRSQPWERLAEAKWARDTVKDLNAMLAKPGFYSPQVWQAAGAKLPERAEELAGRQAAGVKLSQAEQVTLNRLALEAAMGDEIAHPWRTYQLGTVPRYSMIGKAIFVYWPSGFPVQGLFSLPILPNVGKMRLIR